MAIFVSLVKTYLWQKTNKIFVHVIIFYVRETGKLNRRDIFKWSFLKYNDLKSEIHVYNTYKNKLHHTIGAETIKM